MLPLIGINVSMETSQLSIQDRFEKLTSCLHVCGRVCVHCLSVLDGSPDHNRKGIQDWPVGGTASSRNQSSQNTKNTKSISFSLPLSSLVGYLSYFILSLCVCVTPSLEITSTANDLLCPQRSFIE